MPLTLSRAIRGGSSEAAIVAAAQGLDAPRLTDAESTEVMLTDAERDDLSRLETIVRKTLEDHVEGIRSLREIRDRRLYRETHSTFDSYVADRFRKTRQWATREINWLRLRELLIGAGMEQELTVNDANVLDVLCDCPQAIVDALRETEAELALEKESKKKKKKSRREILKEVVQRWRDYMRSEASQRCTYENYRRVDQLCGEEGTQGLTSKAHRIAARDGGSAKSALIELCRQEKALPVKQELLQFARGDDLSELVAALTPLQVQWRRCRDLLARKARLDKEIEAEAARTAPSKEIGATQTPGVTPGEQPTAELRQSTAYDISMRLISHLAGDSLQEAIAQGMEYGQIGAVERITVLPVLASEQLSKARTDSEALSIEIITPARKMITQ
jgi:hypothetical protein